MAHCLAEKDLFSIQSSWYSILFSHKVVILTMFSWWLSTTKLLNFKLISIFLLQFRFFKPSFLAQIRFFRCKKKTLRGQGFAVIELRKWRFLILSFMLIYPSGDSLAIHHMSFFIWPPSLPHCMQLTLKQWKCSFWCQI